MNPGPGGRPGGGMHPLTVAVSGAGGMIGGAFLTALAREGHRVRRLVRRKPVGESGEIFWDPEAGEIDTVRLEGADAVVHLAGANIAGRRWSASRKRLLRTSRIDGTSLIADALASLGRKPAVFVSASATGYYGNRGDEPLDEESGRGDGFLADLCADWESAADRAREAGIRVVHPRIGLVLSGRGGALAKMLPPFRLGMGGTIGDGRQVISWITLDDMVRVLLRLIDDAGLDGPVNAVSPEPVTNRRFMKRLGKALRRPAIMPLPALLVSLLFGEMGRETVLSGARVLPGKLEKAGFSFLFPVSTKPFGKP